MNIGYKINYIVTSHIINSVQSFPNQTRILNISLTYYRSVVLLYFKITFVFSLSFTRKRLTSDSNEFPPGSYFVD